MRSLSVSWLVFALVTASPVDAKCRPDYPAHPMEYFDNATYVFVARVTSVERDDSRRSSRANFQVSEELKGDSSELADVHTEGMHGMHFIEGQEYLFFASENGYVSFCSGSTTRDQAIEDLEYWAEEYRKKGYVK